MNFFILKFKWVMLVSGLLTCTMLGGLFAPASSMQSTFGEVLAGKANELVVRNWSVLIGLIGLMLIYGAFVSSIRRFVLTVAGVSKLVFILLVLSHGRHFISYGAGTAVIADSVMVVLYAIYLLATTRSPKFDEHSLTKI